ncbi:MAG: Kelch repeat-containing protein [candidate division WWE3 bacterium GW2011_GWA2_44_16]|uniref:Kelch repeat-containing protein n=1 Tax=candidate division WWE3 bacterium GW2011_GWA2_44_16 TaxID=1619110 RepID=A0A0G1KD02_UNCKA|nr:MAG: Kelch repeat-containing protein [candidate division WWE3 bacterium GW2011_GWA2_44_16]
MNIKLSVLSVLFVLLTSLIGQQVSATPQGAFVLEGGVNRTEGFVPFVAGTTVQTSTAKPYDVVVTVYRTDGTLTGVRIEITGEQSWAPWVSSGTGTPTFQAGLWIFQMAFPAEGKIEVGLRVSTPTAVDHITVSASDGSGGIETRQADVAPVGQSPTATSTSTSTRTPTATSTSVPPTATPTVTATPSPVVEPLIVLEGGINTNEGFTPFAPTSPITVTTRFMTDIVVTVYNRGEATGARIVVTAHRAWTATVSGGSGKLDFQGSISAEWGQWVYEGPFAGSGPIELVVHTTTPPFRPARWDIFVKAVPLGTGDWQERQVVIQNSRYGTYLPIMVR